jgi:phosphatidylglycerophosphatase A
MDPGSRDRLILWVSQGFGAGKFPYIPGTAGSVAGLAWTALLLGSGSLILFLAGSLMVCGLSVVLTGKAERILGRPDPSSVVLDEIAAMPLCFYGWAGLLAGKEGFPSLAYFTEPANLWLVLAVFLLFRFFDGLKPWPLGQAQLVHGGWGITLDDILAAGYVNLIFLGAYAAGWVEI